MIAATDYFVRLDEVKLVPLLAVNKYSLSSARVSTHFYYVDPAT